ncbi:MAG: hypothetical protein HZB53_01465 [Chloroflexi bacterium]|nr:hypothetical protein [Chloroflexota bacterium]
MKRTLLALGLYLLLALAATHPLWQNLSGAVPGDVGDPVLNAYLLGWDTRALVNDPAHLFDAGIFYPLHGTLAYSENLIGSALLALPVAVLSGEPAVAYNVVFLSGFALSGFGMYLLMLSLTRNRVAAFAAGVAFAFAPYRMASLPHIQLVTLQWLPLALLALRRVIRGNGAFRSVALGGRRHAAGDQRSAIVLLVVCAWWQIATSLHGGLFMALALGVVAVLHLDRWRVWLSPQLITDGAVLALAVLPLAVPYLNVLPELRAARPPDAAEAFLAQPVDWLTPYPGNRLYGGLVPTSPRRDGFSEEVFLFMGVAVPVLALAGLAFRRSAAGRWPLSMFMLLALSLALASSAWLGGAVPLASVMRVPARWGMLTVFALAGLAGFGVAGILEWARVQCASTHAASAPSPATPVLRRGGGLGRGRLQVGTTLGAVVACLLIVAVAADGYSAPILIERIGRLSDQNAVYGALATQPGPGAVIELPLYVAPDAEYPEGKRMFASLVHGRPLVNGYSGLTPARQTELAGALKGFPDDASLSALRALGGQGVRWLVVHSGEPGLPRRDWVQTNRARAQASGLLRFVQSFNDNDLFEIVR